MRDRDKGEVEDPMTILKQQVFKLYPLTPNAWDEFAKGWIEIKVKRKEVITRADDTERYVYMVLDGIQRAYYLHNDKEVTLVFSYPFSFSGVVDSFLLQQPAKYYLETLTDSRLLRLAYGDFAQLVAKHRCIETWLRLSITHVMAGMLVRQVELSAYSAEEKFRALLTRSPHVLNMIPHKYLASYIGVDATNFSKMLATIKL